MVKDNELVKDMSLGDDQPEKNSKPMKDTSEMGLESPSAIEISLRIKTQFPDKDLIQVDDSSSLMRMATGSYKLGDVSIRDLPAKDLNRLDVFLKENKK